MSKKALDVQESLDFIIERMATKSDIDEIKETLSDHTRQLNTIQSDLVIMRDKRLQLETRTTAIEKHLDIRPSRGTR